MEQAKRATYLDTIRILAGLLVTYNHVAGGSMRLFEGSGGAAALFFLYLSKAAIPLFLMVTGALLLNRVEPYGRTLRRAGRIVLALALATLFYYGTDCLLDGAPFSIAKYFDVLYHYEASNSLWYLYAYLGLMLMLPILQRMAAALSAREYLYIAAVMLLFTGTLPILQAASPLFIQDDSFTLPLFAAMIGMPLLGRFLSGEIRFTRARTALALLLPIAVNAAAVALTWRKNVWFGLFDNAFLLPAMLSAVCIFYLIRLLDARATLSERARGASAHVAGLVFGAYLLADFAIKRMQPVREALSELLSRNGAGVVYTFAVYLACLLAAELLTRIPGLKRIL